MSDIDIERRNYKPGEMIFKQGEIGDEAFIIESGKVEIAVGDGTAEIVIGLVDTGDMIGEMALLDSAPRMATARAMAKCTCIVIPKRVFNSLVKQSNPVLVLVIKTLLRRLRSETGANVGRSL